MAAVRRPSAARSKCFRRTFWSDTRRRDRSRAAELDFRSEANHAVSNYQTVFPAVPTVNQNQPPRRIRGERASRVLVCTSRANELSSWERRLLAETNFFPDLGRIVSRLRCIKSTATVYENASSTGAD